MVLTHVLTHYLVSRRFHILYSCVPQFVQEQVHRWISVSEVEGEIYGSPNRELWHNPLVIILVLFSRNLEDGTCLSPSLIQVLDYLFLNIYILWQRKSHLSDAEASLFPTFFVWYIPLVYDIPSNRAVKCSLTADYSIVWIYRQTILYYMRI